MLSKERMKEKFLEMIKIYSPSKEEKEMADYLESWLREKGISYWSDNAGKEYGGNGINIVAFLPGEGEPIGFCAHMDQIEPCRDIHPVIEENWIRTDGTTTLGGDDKGGIAVILEAVEDIIETDTPHRDIYLVFTCSEEISMLGSKNMDMSMLPCKQLVIADATGKSGPIAYRAPAMETIKVIFHGKKAHAGIEPEKGINAIKVAADAISQMHIGRIDDLTTSNIGRIEGGSATNIVTDYVEFTAEIRSHNMDRLKEERDYMEQCCKNAAAHADTTYEFKSDLAYPALVLEKGASIIKEAVQAYKEEGIKSELIVIGGGSDANIFAGYGLQSVILGLGMEQVHTVEEKLNLEEAFTTAKVIRRMMIAK